MTKYNDGKIHGWNGGPCPVHPKTKVRVWLSCGARSYNTAGTYEWDWNTIGDDIIAFQVVEAHFEPKTIWVNEYSNGDVFSYCKENVAKHHARTSATRIAVKYVEVKE
jgi:hypothetical protein